MRALALVLALTTLQPVSAAAQQRPDLSRFKVFADPLVGSWTVTIKDYDAQGKVTWEGTQKRAFTYTLADEFLEERALVQSKSLNREVLMGLHLYSYDPQRNSLLQHGFWPGQPGILFSVEAALSADNRSASGHIMMPREQGMRARRRIEVRWEDATSWSLRAYGKDPAGKEYLNEELIYRRS